jgi:glycosyltransferase involved in cell wall biosynthesis
VFVVLIPAFEPDKTLVSLVDQLIAKMPDGDFPKIIVVNDGSSESSAGIFDNVRSRPSVHLLVHERNGGKGAALKTGFRFVLENLPTAEIVVTADADGQHLADDIVMVGMRALSVRKFVLGVREFPTDVPLRSRFGNLLTRRLFRLFFKLDIVDTQTGLRGIPRSDLADLLTIEMNRYNFEFEALVRLIKKAGAIQAPIQTVYEPGNPSSHFNPLLDSARIYLVFARHVSVVSLLGIFDWLMFTGFSALGLSILASLIAARAISTIVYFLVARTVVFHSTENLLAQAALFLLLVAGNLALLWPFISFIHEVLGGPKSLAMLAGNVFLFASNFLWQNYVIFQRKE